VKEVSLNWPRHEVRYTDALGEHRVASRWVIEATGRQGLLAKRLKLRETVERHPRGRGLVALAERDGPR